MWMDGVIYPLYRFLISIGLLVWACVEIPLEAEQSRKEHTKLHYFLYATNWSFLIFTVSSFVFAVFCSVFNCKKGKFAPVCAISPRILERVNNTASCISCLEFITLSKFIFEESK